MGLQRDAFLESYLLTKTLFELKLNTQRALKVMRIEMAITVLRQ
jgi:hypothetical protein